MSLTTEIAALRLEVLRLYHLGDRSDWSEDDVKRFRNAVTPERVELLIAECPDELADVMWHGHDEAFRRGFEEEMQRPGAWSATVRAWVAAHHDTLCTCPHTAYAIADVV